MRCTCGQQNPDDATRCTRCGRQFRGRNKLLVWLVDAAVGLGLLAALALVVAFDHPKEENAGAARLQTQARLAVTPREYDDMGRLLSELGDGYQWAPISLDDLLDSKRLARYEVVFLTCGTTPPDWLEQESHGRSRNKELRAMRPKIRRHLHDSLRKYVEEGGTLYVSDFRFKYLAAAFPEVIDLDRFADAFPEPVDPDPVRRDHRGPVPQTVHAEVLDTGLQRRLGKELELTFDQIDWIPAAFKEDKVTTILRGDFKLAKGESLTAPLLVKFPFGQGTVIYTAFHNEAQNSEMETELLHYLVFASVLARHESNVRRTMVEGGFSPAEGNLLAASAGDRSITETYHHQEQGDLQFVLAFEDRGATLKLTVTAPDGRTWEETGTATLTIDVPDAPAGDWTYTIEPREIPFRNFPFSLTIGRKPAHTADAP